jgi:Arc/MetJ-type ribon-helix-helix transcriptional regulator
MAPGKAISVELKAGQQAILRRQLESGHYESASEVIGDALRALDEAFTRARLAIARKGKAAKRGA